MKIVIDFNVDDTAADVERFMRALSPIWRLPPGAEWEIDLSNCEYLGPDAACLIAATYLDAKRLGHVPVVRFPNGPEKLRAFCQFVGLAHLLQRGPRPNPDHADSETLPITQFFQAMQNHALSITKLVFRHRPDLGADDELYLQTSLHEAVQNIEDHADSPVGGVFCGRFFSSRREVRVAVVDRGVGFVGSLSTRFGPLDPVDALRKVLKGGFTSRSTQRNMGLGVSNLAEIVRRLRGDLFLCSGSAAARVSSDHTSVTPLDFEVPGAAVFFRLRL